MTTTLLHPGEAARRLGVTPATLRKWVADGTLCAERTAGGHLRIPASEVERHLRRQKRLSLRPFQRRNAADLVKGFDGHRVVVYSAPPGAGKTVVVSATVCALKQFDYVLATPPLRSIAQAFLGLGAYETLVAGEELGTFSCRDLWLPFTSEVEGKLEGAWAALWEAPARLVATHGLLTHAQKLLAAGSLSWPAPALMARALLVMDEGHHAGGEVDRDRAGDEGDRNVIAAFAEAWVAHGGALLYASATIHRGDGWTAVPPDAPWVVRSLAAHAREGYAPFHWCFENVPMLERVVQEPETWPAHTARAMAEHWERLDRPKTVIIVPQWAAGVYAAPVEAAFLAAGARVLNAVGKGAAIRDRFETTLAAERLVTDYADSKIDVIIACVRMREGADWPLAAVVFSVGAVSSLPSALQLFGRMMRLKRLIRGYPLRWVDTAALVTFLPGSLSGRGEQSEMDAGAVRQNSLETTGILVLLAEDAAMGHELVSLFRRRAWGLAGRRVQEVLTPDVEPELHGRALEAANAAVFDAGFVPPGAAADADPATWPRKSYTAGELLAAVLAQIARRELPLEAARLVLGQIVGGLIVVAPHLADPIVRYLADVLGFEEADLDKADGDEPDEGGGGDEADGEGGDEDEVGGGPRGPNTWRRIPPSEPSPHLLVEAFCAVIQQYQDHVILHRPDSVFGLHDRLRVIARFTATDASRVAEAVRARYSGSVSEALPTGSELAAMLESYWKEYARVPEANAESAFAWTGIAASWRAIDDALRAGDPPMGLRAVRIVRHWFDRQRLPDLTVDTIRAALAGVSATSVMDIPTCNKTCVPGFDPWMLVIGQPPQWMKRPQARAPSLGAKEHWPLIDLALRWGFRGLPGHQTLRPLVEEACR